ASPGSLAMAFSRSGNMGVTSTTAHKPMFVARFGRIHRGEFVSRCSAQRTHRPRHPPALAVRRYLRSSTRRLCHLPLGGLTAPVSPPNADVRHTTRSKYCYTFVTLDP